MKHNKPNKLLSIILSAGSLINAGCQSLTPKPQFSTYEPHKTAYTHYPQKLFPDKKPETLTDKLKPSYIELALNTPCYDDKGSLETVNWVNLGLETVIPGTGEICINKSREAYPEITSMWFLSELAERLGLPDLELAEHFAVGTKFGYGGADIKTKSKGIFLFAPADVNTRIQSAFSTLGIRAEYYPWLNSDKFILSLGAGLDREVGNTTVSYQGKLFDRQVIKGEFDLPNKTFKYYFDITFEIPKGNDGWSVFSRLRYKEEIGRAGESNGYEVIAGAKKSLSEKTKKQQTRLEIEQELTRQALERKSSGQTKPYQNMGTRKKHPKR